MQRNKKLTTYQQTFHHEIFKEVDTRNMMYLFVTGIQDKKEVNLQASFLASKAELTMMFTSMFVNLHKYFNDKDVQEIVKEAYLDALQLLTDEGIFSDE